MPQDISRYDRKALRGDGLVVHPAFQKLSRFGNNPHCQKVALFYHCDFDSTVACRAYPVSTSRSGHNMMAHAIFLFCLDKLVETLRCRLSMYENPCRCICPPSAMNCIDRLTCAWHSISFFLPPQSVL